MRHATCSRLNRCQLGMDVGCQFLGRLEAKFERCLFICEEISEEGHGAFAGSPNCSYGHLTLGGTLVRCALLSTPSLSPFRQHDRRTTAYNLPVHWIPALFPRAHFHVVQ